MTGPMADAAIKIVPDVRAERGVVAVVIGVTGTHTVHWGDGSSSDGTGAPLLHTYASAGARKVTVRDAAGAVVVEGAVTVRDGMAPAISFAPAADNPLIIEATINSDPPDVVSEYEVTWEAGAVEKFFGPKGTVKIHGFKAGDHTITYRDLHTGRAGSTEVEVKDKEYDPDFSIGKGADVNTAQLEITRLVTPGKEMLIDWGDYGQTTVPAADAAVGYKVSHPYTEAGDYIVQFAYADGSTATTARVVTIPFAARARR